MDNSSASSKKLLNNLKFNRYQSPEYGKKMFLRKGDRNKAFAVNIIKNNQKISEYENQGKNDVITSSDKNISLQGGRKQFKKYGEVASSLPPILHQYDSGLDVSRSSIHMDNFNVGDR